MTRLFTVLAGALLACAAWGPSERPASAAPAASDCRSCHTRDKPTRESPALVPCPRLAQKGSHSVEDGPKTVAFDDCADKRGPVRFDHRKHAEMAQMGDACYGCHHFNQSRRISSCKECHSVSRARTDLSKPDLNAARHRLCLDCHLAWNPETACDSCHGKRRGDGGSGKPRGKAAPKAVVPDRVVFKTPSAAGKTVVFLHRAHAADYGFKCADCHRDQTCASCHVADRLALSPSALAHGGPRAGGRHRACFSCHGKDDCARCHHAP